MQSTLADSFLDDLDELDDDLSEEESGGEADAAGGAGGASDAEGGEGEGEGEDEEANLDDMLGTLVESTGVRTVTKLKHSTRFSNHMAAVAKALSTPRTGTHGVVQFSCMLQGAQAWLPPTDDFVGNLEDDPEYRLIVASNQLMADIEDEISAIHKYVNDLYSKKFPSLENSITDPMDYFRVVKLIGNETVRCCCCRF